MAVKFSPHIGHDLQAYIIHEVGLAIFEGSFEEKKKDDRDGKEKQQLHTLLKEETIQAELDNDVPHGLTHIAHLILASEAQVQLSLERVLWVLTPVPLHKPDRIITPIAIRCEMVQAAIHENPTFEFSSVDVDRDPPHYAADTMLLLKQSYPQAHLTYLMGADSLRDLPKWHQPELFIQRCEWLGVMRRPGDAVDLTELEHDLPGVSEKVIFIGSPLLQISAREIRRRVASSEPVRYYLPQRVYEIILNRGLYQATG